MRLNKRILKLLEACFDTSEACGFEQEEEVQPGISDPHEEVRVWLAERLSRYQTDGDQ